LDLYVTKLTSIVAKYVEYPYMPRWYYIILSTYHFVHRFVNYLSIYLTLLPLDVSPTVLPV